MFSMGTSGLEQRYLQADSFICPYPEENVGLFFLGVFSWKMQVN